MKVTRFKTPFGENEQKHRTVVSTDECYLGTIQSRMIRQELLGYIANDPFFSQCGGTDFQRMKMFHDGEKWIAEFESIVAKPQS